MSRNSKDNGARRNARRSNGGRRSQKRDFKKMQVIELEDVELKSIKFVKFTYPDRNTGEEKTDTKAVMLFAPDFGDGETIQIEAFGDCCKSLKEDDPQPGELFSLTCNLYSKEYKNDDGETDYITKVKCWKYEIHD